MREEYERARHLYACGQYEEALGALTALVADFPDAKEALFSRGLCLVAMGRTYEARLEFRKLQSRFGPGPWTKLEASIPRADFEEEAGGADGWSGAPREPESEVRYSKIGGVALILVVVGAVSIALALSGREAAAPVAQVHLGRAPAAEPLPVEPDPDDEVIAEDIALPDMGQVLIPEPVRVADIPTLLKLMEDGATLAPAFAELRRRATAFDLEHLNHALHHSPVHHVRYCAAIVMGEIGSSTSIRPLLDALHKSSSRWVRRESALALGRIGTERVVEPLDSAMRTDKDTSVRKYAARGLFLCLGTKAAPYFQTALATEQDPGCILALRWLCDTEFKGTRPPLIAPGEASYGSLSGMLYKVYTPKTYDPARPCNLLVSVHGTDGRPDAYLSMGQATADRENCLVLAPYFDAFNFPLYDMLNSDVHGIRSDLRLLEIIDTLPQLASVIVDRFYLFGHSKGGQFVLRFVMAHPDRILRAAACGFGNAIMPNENANFPMGMKPNALMPDLASISFGDLASAKMAVIVGSEDSNRSLVEEFASKAEDYAKRHATDYRIVLTVVPGGHHSGAENFPSASRFFFGR